MLVPEIGEAFLRAYHHDEAMTLAKRKSEGKGGPL